MSLDDTLRVAGLVEDSIVDGDGFRFTIFVQGFSRFGLDLGFWTITIAHIMFCIPYVMLSVTPKLRSLKSAHCPAVAHWRRASSRLVAKNDVCQWALKPCASMSRRLGR